MPLGVNTPMLAPNSPYSPYAYGAPASYNGPSVMMTAGQGGGSANPNGAAANPTGGAPGTGTGPIDWGSLLQTGLSDYLTQQNNENATNAVTGAAGQIVNQQGQVQGTINNLWTPQTTVGGGAIGSLGASLGLGTGGVIDPTAFESTPGYTFALSQGDQGINRAAAAGGNAYSTTTAANLAKFNQGLASTTYQNYISNLLQTAGLSTSANTSLTGANLQTGGNIAQAIQNAGNASATGAYAKGGIMSSLMNNPIVSGLVKQYGNGVLNYFTGAGAGPSTGVISDMSSGAYGSLDASTAAQVSSDASGIGADTSSTIGDWLGGGFNSAGGGAATGAGTGAGTGAAAAGASAGIGGAALGAESAGAMGALDASTSAAVASDAAAIEASNAAALGGSSTAAGTAAGGGAGAGAGVAGLAGVGAIIGGMYMAGARGDQSSAAQNAAMLSTLKAGPGTSPQQQTQFQNALLSALSAAGNWGGGQGGYGGTAGLPPEILQWLQENGYSTQLANVNPNTPWSTNPYQTKTLGN